MRHINIIEEFVSRIGVVDQRIMRVNIILVQVLLYDFVLLDVATRARQLTTRELKHLCVHISSVHTATAPLADPLRRGKQIAHW